MIIEQDAELDRILAECDRVLELDAKATPGPWEIGHRPNLVKKEGVRGNVASCAFTHSHSLFKNLPSGDESCRNADFIAASRTITPRLARALKVAIAGYRNLLTWDNAIVKKEATDALRNIIDLWTK